MVLRQSNVNVNRTVISPKSVQRYYFVLKHLNFMFEQELYRVTIKEIDTFNVM